MSTQPTQWRVPEWTLADRLRKIRTDLNMHQRDMARLLGVTPSAYAAWESGRNVPANIVSLAKRIELLTDVPAVWTLGLDTANDGPRPGVRGEGRRVIGLPRLDSDQQPSDVWLLDQRDADDVTSHGYDGWGRAA